MTEFPLVCVKYASVSVSHNVLVVCVCMGLICAMLSVSEEIPDNHRAA